MALRWRTPPGGSLTHFALLRRSSAFSAILPVSGVQVPLPSTQPYRDTSQITLGEHKFALVHVRGGEAGSSSSPPPPAVSAYLRSGGQVFPAISVPLDEELDAGAIQQQRHGADEHEASEAEQREFGRPPPSRGQQLLRTQFFQIYAQRESPRGALSQLSPEVPKISSPVVEFIRSCYRVYSSLSSALTGPPLFVPASALAAACATSASPVVRAIDVHPTLPMLALLVRDEVHCYDVFRSSMAGADSLSGGSAAATSAALASSLTLDRSAIVQGAWVPRVLRHPLMARACSVAFAPPGGNLLAVGTELGVLCLWQLVSVPAAASGHATAASGGFASGGASTRRMGAWLRVLHHPSLAGLPLSHVAFSPCGRWLAVASACASHFVLWDVAAAMAGSESAAIPIQKLLRSKHHGIDLLRWSPSGDRLLVASHPMRTRSPLALAAHLASCAWNLATGRSAQSQPQAPLAEDADAAPAGSRSSSLPRGTLTIWDATAWTHQSWSTLAPVSDARWSTGAPGASSSSLLLLSLRGSSVIQSLHLPSTFRSARAVTSSSSSLANASVRVDCRPVEGLPPTRAPSDPERGLDRYFVGGHVARMAWSRGDARLAVGFEEVREEEEAMQRKKKARNNRVDDEEKDSDDSAAPAAGGDSATDDDPTLAELGAASELVALFALNRDRTDTFQVLPVGMIRGPPCPCQGRVHPLPTGGQGGQARRKQTTTASAGGEPAPMDEDEDAALERKHNDPAESSVYPSLSAALVPRAESSPPPGASAPCARRNPPVHLGFLSTHAARGELLAVVWKFGQVSFVPMYFEK